MPGEDRKGPMSQGPRTGRGLGRCNGNETNPVAPNDQTPADRGLKPSKGRGRGLGAGQGRGLGRGPGRGRGGGRGGGRG